jgi:hypothetical protein
VAQETSYRASSAELPCSTAGARSSGGSTGSSLRLRMKHNPPPTTSPIGQEKCARPDSAGRYATASAATPETTRQISERRLKPLL